MLQYFTINHVLRLQRMAIFTLGLVLMTVLSTAQATTTTTPKGTTMSTNPKVLLKTNKGDITLELDAEKAPKTTENFLNYVNNGFYNGTIFHRVINNFMVQGGGFEVGMKQKETQNPIENEANNGLKNEVYTVAMARTNDPHSATAQFFINVQNNDFLNHTNPTPNGWGYAVFGKVVDGTDVVDTIKGVKTGSKGFHQDVPVEDVIIESATVLE
ncbi:peptidyl-prolyl cis-trans isomerase [Paenalcaligenes hominis]|nr:peptidyl-prolyl cis-trans isomerase [Paenalcaligenes hominis]